MALPKAVREAGERSDRLIEEFKKAQQEGREFDPNAALNPEQTQQTPEPQPNLDPAPAPAPAQPPQQQQTGKKNEAAGDRDDRQDWKAKYHTLQGMYNAEVPRYAVQVRELKATIAELQKEVEELRKAKTESNHPTGEATDWRQKFDPELVEMVERLAEEKARKHFQPVAERVQKSEFETFIERVDARVQGRAVLDSDPEFYAFMHEVDPFSGQVRQDLMNDAAQKQDVERVVRFYDAFLSTKRSVAPAPVEPPAAPPPQQQHRVVPQQTGSPGAPAMAKVWTVREINAFYAAVSKGQYRGREQAAAEIESDILSAQAEGRIRG